MDLLLETSPLEAHILASQSPFHKFHPEIINQELVDKSTTSCISGPFSLDEASSIFGDCFHPSPMGLVEEVPGDGVWSIIWHLLKWDADGQSKNNWVNSDEFP